MRSSCLLIGFLIGVSLLGCGRGFDATGGASEVWLPWPNPEFTFEIRPIRIETLKTPQRASGPAAKVYVSTGGDNSGFIGPVAEPILYRVGKRRLPKDVPSSEALVTYAVFERLMKFDESLGAKQNLTWPRRVGVQINLKSENGSIFSNALYDVESDSIVIARNLYKGAPLAINHGVLAHEHFHAHFARAFNNAVKMKLDSKDENFKVNNIVLATLNEGLADFYGTVFTGDLRFAERSFGAKGKSRELNDSLGQFSIWMSQIGQVEDEREIIYGNGTLLARALLLWGRELGPKRVLDEVLKNLPAVIEELVEKTHRQKIDPSDFYVSLLAHQSLPVTAEWCGKIRAQSSGRIGVLRGCP